MTIRYISHRGNINSILKDMENTPKYIDDAINKNYDVEIDVRCIDGKLYLGHDTPDTLIDKEFLFSRRQYLWVHCKNIEALYKLSSEFNTFSHDRDDAVLTSKGFIWTYPGKKLTNDSICVLPENVNYSTQELLSCFGICSDYIKTYQQKIEEHYK